MFRKSLRGGHFYSYSHACGCGKNFRFAFGNHRSTTAVVSRKSLSGSQVPLRDLMPGLSHFQFWILFDTRFDDIDVICRLGGPYSKKTLTVLLNGLILRWQMTFFFVTLLNQFFHFFFHPYKHAPLRKYSKLTDVVKRNFFILIL